MYLSGHSTSDIAAKLTELGLPTREGNLQWHCTAINYILQNERYSGNALLQKSYMMEVFPYKRRKNNGERERYLFIDSNPPIVSKEVFDAAQLLMLHRAEKITLGTNVRLPLAGKIQCGCCDAYFKKKLHGQKVCWICRTHNANKSKCSITQISQHSFYYAFLRLYYNLKHHTKYILGPMLSSLQEIRNCRMLWSEDIMELNHQISQLTSQNQMLATLKEQGLIDPDIFISQSNELTQQLRAAKQKKERLLATDDDDIIQRTRDLMEVLDAGPDFLDSFDADLFGELVDKIIVDSNEQLRFCLKNGLELTETIERTVR